MNGLRSVACPSDFRFSGGARAGESSDSVFVAMASRLTPKLAEANQLGCVLMTDPLVDMLNAAIIISAK